MRYRIGEEPDQAYQQLDGMTVGTAVFGLVTGILFTIAGIKTRQLWLIVWGSGLAVASLIYLGYSIFWL